MGAVVVLISVSLMAPLPVVPTGEIPGTDARLQVKVVPGVLLAGV